MKKIGLVLILLMVFLTPSLVFADTDFSTLTTLRNQVSEVINQQNATARYEENSYNAFYQGLTNLGGLAAVDALLSDPLSEQSAVDQMELNLQQIINYLTVDATYISVMNQYYSEKTRVLTSYTLRSITTYELELARIKDLLDEPTSGETLVSSLSSAIVMAPNMLILLGDKTDLIAQHQLAESIYLDGSVYLPQTYTLFINAYDAINLSLSGLIGFTKEQVISNNDASVHEVAETLLAINNALDLLIVKPDKTTFISNYNEMIDELEETLYTPNSVVLFLAETDRIYQEVIKEETTLEQLSNYELELTNALNLLVLRADTSSLEELNNSAIIAYYEEKVLYTASSYQLFKTAVLAYGSYLTINAKISDPNISQSEVDILSLIIQDALNLLEVQQDNTDLIALYQQSILTDDSIYTPHSISLYNSELERIEVLIHSDNLNTALYLEIENDLTLAPSLLVLKADISALSQLYATALTFEGEDYSDSSFMYLQRIIIATQYIINDANIDQTTVDETYITLEEAISFLRKPTELITIHAGDVFNIMDYITLGDGTVQGIISSEPSVLSVDGFGKAHGIEFGNSIVTVYLSNGISESIPVLVKQNVAPFTLTLAILVPILASGLAAMTLYFKPATFKVGVANLWKKIKK